MKRFYTESQNRLLTGELEQLRQTIASGNYQQGDGPVLRIGAERESFLIDGSGAPATKAPELIAVVGQSWCKPEFPTFAIEVSTAPFKWGPDALEQLGLQLQKRTDIVRDGARSLGVQLLDIGLLPSYSETGSQESREVCSPASRYKNLLSYLGNRNGEYQFKLGKREIQVAASPVPGGVTGSFQPNVQFNPNFLGHAANLTSATAWIWPIIASSSPLAFGDEALWNSRIPTWRFGMDHEGKLASFGIGDYYKERGVNAIIEWAEALIGSEAILTFEEVEFDPASHPFPSIALATGTKWTQTGRMRIGPNTDNKLQFYFEQRLLDTGLTLADDIENMAFYLGLIVRLSHCDKAQELISYSDAQRVFYQAAELGNCSIPWRGSPRDGKTLILEELIPIADEGLKQLFVPSAIARKLLSNIENRLKYPQTAADFIRNAFRTNRIRQPHEAAVRQVCKELANLQQDQLWSGYYSPGIADFFPTYPNC